jgi:hypothetical protein
MLSRNVVEHQVDVEADSGRTHRHRQVTQVVHRSAR